MGRDKDKSGSVHGNIKTVQPVTDITFLSKVKGLLGIQATVDHDNYHLHLGETQRVTYYTAPGSEIADDAFVDIFFEAGSKSLHLRKIIVSHQGTFLHTFYDERNGEITPTPATGTNLITGANKTTWNASGDYPGIATSASQILASPTYTPAIPPPLWGFYLEAGTVGSRISVTQEIDEYIIKDGTAAILRFTNLSGLASRFSIEILFVEETPGGLGDA